jgi:murein L,D-transpeptidase YafK
MSEQFDKPEAPWLAPNDRWRWLGVLRRSPARTALVGVGIALGLAFMLGSGWGVSKSGAVASTAPAAATTPELPAERVTMKLSAQALADQLRPLARAADLVAASDLQPATPEARLMAVYALMSQGQGRQALEAAQKLSTDVPTFGLAQLVYADLLSGLTLGNPGFATYPPTLRDASAERLEDLTAEARARITAAGSRPPAGAVPSQFVFLAPSVRFAMAVDVSKSRLYLFENTPAGPVLKHDYYASVGKLGTSKRIEGDLRTPLGVYFVNGALDPRKLAERYGAGALPLNYPNQLDQLRGRTGSGIWLHGVEPATFTRAPLATDGCVAVSNPDLREISQLVHRQQTPVVIAESLNWVDAAKAPAQQSDFMQRFNAWREARLAKAEDLQQKFYSQTTHTPADASSATASQAQRDERSRSSAAVSVNNLSVLAWRDEDEVMIVTYTEGAKREAQGRLKRQYWLRQGGDWTIIFEGTIS